MAESNGTVSLWMQTPHLPGSESFTGACRADVCIIGGGITGLTCAYLLARSGKQVIVLEAREFGVGETSRTSAHLSSAVDDYFHKIEKMHGAEKSKLVFESHAAAINLIERICHDEKIECDFSRVPGFLWAQRPADHDLLKKEQDAALKAGFKQVRWHDKLPFRSHDNSAFACLEFPDQAQFHPQKYLAGLLKLLPELGVKIYGMSRVEKVKGGSPVHVQLKTGEVSAGAAIVATNALIHGASLFPFYASYRSYVIACPIPRGFVPAGLYWDTEDPYHYVRAQQGKVESEDLLLIGGEDHRVGQDKAPEERFVNLYTWAQKIFGGLPEPTYRWSGEILEPADGLAFIGKDPGKQEHVYVATGDSGMGLTHGTIAGILLTDMICQRQNAWEELYSPARLPLADPVSLIEENMASGLPYIENLLPARGNEYQLTPGDGCVISEGLDKIAVSLDDNGKRCKLSASCTHKGAIVAWNGVEKSWDCPAHGSRFDGDGSVLFGPANQELNKV